MRWLLTILGMISLGLAILGIFLPVLPTTPLLLLAAALFLRSNRGLYDWLLNHPRLGPYITNFMVHAKAALWTVTDAEARKRGEQTGLDTLVVHAVNDEY